MFRRRRLPHWDVPGGTYFVTSCLHGSIPAEGLLDLAQYRASLERCKKPDHISNKDWKIECWKRTFARCDNWLDCHPAVKHLANPVLAKIVADSIYFYAGKRYDLLAYVVMPSHIHWVFTPLHDWEQSLPEGVSARQTIMHSLKRYSAVKCNTELLQEGTFWQEEAYDHCTLDENELERILAYVELNPVKAGLVKSRELYLFSSAHDRDALGIPLGRALLRPDLDVAG